MRTDEYVQAARELFVPETNCAEVYYQFREEFNKSQDPFRRAVLFLYLNRYGYNGLCRYNLRGEFNVPFGRYKKPYFPEAELYHFAEKAQNAFFYCESYADSMARADDASVVYCDPPLRRCLRLPTIRRITQTVLRLNNKRIWRRSLKVWLIAIFRC